MTILSALSTRFLAVRRATTALCEPLEIEDFVLQTLPDVSPPKWHLAHTTWFFETFALAPFSPAPYQPVDPAYNFLFNSYYETVGQRWDRPRRGLLSRPTVEAVMSYRDAIDQRMTQLIEAVSTADDAAKKAEFRAIVEIGLQHEQQHQELLLTDIKHILCTNPDVPVYRAQSAPMAGDTTALKFVPFAGGRVEMGFTGNGFAFDNESPRHPVWLSDFQLANRLVTAGEYRQFIDAGGYRTATLWLADGWETLNREGWQAPLYWRHDDTDGTWTTATLAGRRPLDPAEPVCHLSFYEADAFARWAGYRLPTEFEWEHAATSPLAPAPALGNFVESQRFHPSPLRLPSADEETEILHQLFGDVWEWTQSAYLPYPGFRAAVGALGEYNGKFMCNQMVLRGGSCATPADHVRATYRNFFHPDKRWQFTGIRLAADA